MRDQTESKQDSTISELCPEADIWIRRIEKRKYIPVKTYLADH